MIIALLLVCLITIGSGCLTAVGQREGARMAKAAKLIDKVFDKAMVQAPTVIDTLVLSGKISQADGERYKSFMVAYAAGGPATVFEQWVDNKGNKKLTEEEEAFVSTLLKGSYDEAGTAAVAMVIQRGVDEGKITPIEAIVFKAVLKAAYEQALATTPEASNIPLPK